MLIDNVTEQLNGGREIFLFAIYFFAKVVDFYIVLRYTNYIEVQCIALEFMGGV